jgi:hypothetical protein
VDLTADNNKGVDEVKNLFRVKEEGGITLISGLLTPPR